MQMKSVKHSSIADDIQNKSGKRVLLIMKCVTLKWMRCSHASWSADFETSRTGSVR